MSSLPNTHLTKKQNQPAILTAYFHLLNGKYNMVFIFIMVLIIFKLELKDCWTCISLYLWTINFPEWRSCTGLPAYPQNYSRLPCKSLFLQADWGLPHRMNGILISTNYISITKTTHAAREKCFVLASVLHKIYNLLPKPRLWRLASNPACCSHLHSHFSLTVRFLSWAVKNIHLSTLCISETTSCNLMWSKISIGKDSITTPPKEK